MEAAVPGEIIDPGRRLEKDNWLSMRFGCAPRHQPGHLRNHQVIDVAQNPALEALIVEIIQAHDAFLFGRPLPPYQLLFFSYPSCTSRSGAIFLNNFLCSSVKYCLQLPVWPDRKVRDFPG